MFRHVVMFSWADSTPQPKRDEAVAALRAWGTAAEEYGKVTVGTDAGLSTSNHDVVVVADFPDQESYERYSVDEDHVALVRDHLAPHISNRSAVQHPW